MAERRALRALADRLGILPAYTDDRGRPVHTGDDARVALLAAMGTDASTDRVAERNLRRIDQARRGRLFSPARVLRSATRGAVGAELTAPRDLGSRVEWSLDLQEEDGAVHHRHGEHAIRGSRRGLRLPLPACLPLGVHRLRVTLRAGNRERSGAQTLIVVPSRCPTATERLGNRRVFGLHANLYTLRSSTNWGIGDCTDLRRLLAWSGKIGATFVGINPLHALRNRGTAIAPYSPLSRLFRNLLYLDVSAIPELAESEEAQRRIESAETRAELARLRETDRVDYERLLTLKSAVCRSFHQTFAARHRGRDTKRGRAYASYLHGQGRALIDFATFLALDAFFGTAGGTGNGWRGWPAAFRHPGSKAVEAFREQHAEEIDFHCYLQFEVDRQLQLAAQAGRRAGLPIGLYQDLALGSSPGGSDCWAFPSLFVDGATLGAPPDAYSLLGQDWGLPPLDPHHLAEDGYRYWIAVLRAALAHAGALRIDHVMGLFRQYWVPAGRPPTEGAYVRFPAEDLLGILALESRRADAIVVGEDLGTVPVGLPRTLARWGILSSRVLYFEQTGRGAFRSPSRYPGRALVTVNTHDMAPLQGYLHGRDIELRRQAGLYPSDAEFAHAYAQRQREAAALIRRLHAEDRLGISPLPSPAAQPVRRGASRKTRRRERGATPSDTGEAGFTPPPHWSEICAAVHAFLCRTPCRLLGLSLDDLAGETEPVNLPGAGLDRYPSWSRRIRRPLESLRTDPAVQRVLAAVKSRRISKR